MDASELIAGLREALAAAGEDIVCAYLFGSHARGDAGTMSDIDVAVLFRRAPPANLDGLRFDLAGTLEARLHRPVDLVILNHAPADLVHRVLRDGILVAENDRSSRIRFEVIARNQYFDMAPLRARYRAARSEHAT